MYNDLEKWTHFIDTWTHHSSEFAKTYFSIETLTLDAKQTKNFKKNQRILCQSSTLHILLHLYSSYGTGKQHTQGGLTTLVSGHKKNTAEEKEHRAKEDRVKRVIHMLLDYKFIKRKEIPTSSHGTVSYEISATLSLISFIDQFFAAYL